VTALKTEPNNAKEAIAALTVANTSKPEKFVDNVSQEPPRPASVKLVATKSAFACLLPLKETPTRSARRLEEERDIATPPPVSANKDL